MTDKTLQERLRERAKNIWAAHIPKDEGMFPQMDLLGEAADALDAQAERIASMERRLHEIAEEWAGAECGEPVTAQEAYAIHLCKRMYQIATEEK